MKHNCDHCLKSFNIRHPKQFRKRGYAFCCQSCVSKHQTRKRTRDRKIGNICEHCKKEIVPKISRSKKEFVFCSKSCSGRASLKSRKSTIRSKCEIKLFKLLKEVFPTLDIIHNDRLIFDGLEADIYIPSLKLAIEWNGILHFQPIYGEKNLLSKQRNDAIKQELARQKGIDLIVIADIKSTDKYVHEVFTGLSDYIKAKL